MGGNITKKEEFPYTLGDTLTPTKVYDYKYEDINWKDKLTSFDGKAVTYDAIGNTLTYDNWNFTWERGRQLKSMTKEGTSLSFKYNDAGIRTEKTVNGVVTKYHLVGDKVTYDDNGIDKIYYTYDSNSNLVSMNLNGIEYYYIRNAQGDITGLFDKTGAQVVSYTYDSWGKLVSIDGTLKDTIGVKNPYRYRGYRYDSETGLYYLQSRYYNPIWGRFINADAIAGSVGELLGHNVFAYCKNNVVNMSDPSGFRPAFDNEVTQEKYEDWVWEQHQAKVQAAARRDYVKGVAQGLATSTAYSIGESVGAEATLGHTIIPYGKMPIPVKMSTFENVGSFFKVVGASSLSNSLQDNFSGKYSKGEAWIRTTIDVIAFGAGLTLEGGWVAVGIGLLIGVTSEGVKAGVGYLYTRKVTN